MGVASKVRTAVASGAKSARDRRANKRAIKARRRVSRNSPASGGTSPGMYGVGGPGQFGGGG